MVDHILDDDMMKSRAYIVTQTLFNLSRMCGNDVSTIVEPDAGFTQKVLEQISSGKVCINNHKVTMQEIVIFKRMATFKIKELQLNNCGIDHTLLQALLTAEFTNLERLCLNNNKIGPIGCRVIASADSIRGIKSLELNKNKIKDVGMKALTTALFEQLQDLSLNDNELTSESISNLKTLPYVECLALCGNSIDDQAAATLKNLKPEGLIFLGLSRNKMTEKGMKELIKIKGLEVLLIDRNRVKGQKSEINAPKELFLFY